MLGFDLFAGLLLVLMVVGAQRVAASVRSERKTRAPSDDELRLARRAEDLKWDRYLQDDWERRFSLATGQPYRAPGSIGFSDIYGPPPKRTGVTITVRPAPEYGRLPQEIKPPTIVPGKGAPYIKGGFEL